VTTPYIVLAPLLITAAAERIRSGGVVGMPTETVYGLAADALNPLAVARVFEIKNRPFFDPLIVHLSEADELPCVAKDVPEQAKALIKNFWPGPLTLVLPKTDAVPDIVTSGLPTVAVRVPDHPIARLLIKEAGTPIAAPSANLFGRVSPTTAQHVRDQLGDAVDIVLDGGPCRVGLESTIVAFDGPRACVLRLGGVTIEELERAIGSVEIQKVDPAKPQAPGNLPQHYAPRTPLVLGDRNTFTSAGKRAGLLTLGPCEAGGFATIEVLSAAGDLREAATKLYAAMRALDAADLDVILAEPVPEEGLGRAINDRLKRAANTGGA